MRCDTCQQDAPVVMRVVVAKDYNRVLARPVYNCPACFEEKEQGKPYQGATEPLGGAGVSRAGGRARPTATSASGRAESSSGKPGQAGSTKRTRRKAS